MVNDGGVRVQVLGIRELQAALRQVDASFGPEFRDALKAVADDVVRVVQQRMPWGPGNKRLPAGSAEKSVKSRSSSTGASIAVGGQAAPHYMFLDMGGSTGRGHIDRTGGSGAVKRPWLGAPTTPPGRYLFVAIHDEKEATRKRVEDALMKVARRHGFEAH